MAVGDDSLARLERLADLSQQLLDRARALGASQAEVSCSEDRGLEVNVRLGEVETVQSTRDRGIAVTVYFGQRKGSASTGDLNEASLAATVEQACAIARHTEDDPAAGLAEAALMATDFPTWMAGTRGRCRPMRRWTWPWLARPLAARPMRRSAIPMALPCRACRACRCTPIRTASSAVSAAPTILSAAR